MCDLRARSWLVYVFVLYHSNPHHFDTQLQKQIKTMMEAFEESGLCNTTEVISIMYKQTFEV